MFARFCVFESIFYFCLFVCLAATLLLSLCLVNVFTVVVSLILEHNLHFHQSSPIVFYFKFSFIHWWRIRYIECKWHGLPLPVQCMGKSFKAIFCSFCFAKGILFFLSVLSCPEQPLVLTLAFVFNFTSFDYDGKGTRDVSLTCKCHLSNIMSDSMFNETGNNLAFFFHKKFVLLFTVSCKRKCSFITLASVNVHKFNLKRD